MQEAAAVRWRKYGKDRLYVNAADGSRLGWRDLLTGADNLEPGASAEVYHAVVNGWLDEQPALRQRETVRQRTATCSGDDALAGERDGVSTGTDPEHGPKPSEPAVDGRDVLVGEAPSASASDYSVAAVVDGAGGTAIAEQATQGSTPAESAATEHEHDVDELVASLVAADESDVAPDHDAALDAEATDDEAWEDLAERLPGAAARAEAVRLRRESPIRTAVARVLRVHTDERAWRIGADGEEKIAVRLAKLAKRDPQWRFLHAVPVGDRGSDIDHLIIGPPGVFTLNAKNHPGAKIWIGGDTFLVNGQRQPYVRNGRFEARRAARLLSAATSAPVVAVGVIVPVGAADIRVKKLPADVKVVNRMRLVRWLESLPPVLPPERIDALFNAARRSTTWQPAK
ncbi:MAG TPA: NERD domain-containing protein [Acidimicrobiales bacterium]|nr:NERD domain-containing protein [Acidimicrobiales bacterium]